MNGVERFQYIQDQQDQFMIILHLILTKVYMEAIGVTLAHQHPKFDQYHTVQVAVFRSASNHRHLWSCSGIHTDVKMQRNNKAGY